MQNPVLLLTLTVGVIGANSLVLSPISASVAADISGVDPADVMRASALYGLGVALSALTLAPQADRVGSGRALLVAMAGLAVSLAGSALAPNLFTLMAMQSVSGVCAGVAIPSAYSLAAQVSKPGQEAKTMGAVLTGWTLSMVGGVTLSALISEVVGWRMVFMALCALTAVLTLMLRTCDFGKSPATGRVISPLKALSLPEVGPGLVSVLALGGGFYGIYNYLGPYLETHLGRGPQSAGVLTLSYGIGFGTAMLLDSWIDRFGPRRALAIVFAGLVPFYLVFAVAASTFALMVPVMFAWGIVQHLGLNLTVGRLTRIAPEQRGAIMGLNSAAMYLTVFGATLVFRPVYDLAGLPGCAALSCALAGIGLAEALIARFKAVKSPV